MPITGTDEISIKILNSLRSGIKLKDIPSMFPVSLDQAKRLSRYANLLEKANTYLHTSEIEKLQIVGIKSLHLSSLFKQEDWEGLVEILSSINEHTKRDEFPLLIQALQEKRKRISDFQQDVERKLNYLQKREEELHQLEQMIKETQRKIAEETTFLKKFSDNVQLFFIKHLGIYNDKLVLARRLDSRWQRSMKQKGILSYSEMDYIWYVMDLDKMAADYLKRSNRKVPLGTEWDYDKEDHRNRNGEYHTPSRPEYRLPNGLAMDLRSSIEEVEVKMNEIKTERESIQKEMKQLKKTSPKSFLESIEATNTLSAQELRRHGELQDKALKWLFNKGYVVASEVTLPNGKRADVIGYNENGHIMIIEVKVSRNDFQQDQKWTSYLDYCDEFYFLLSKEALPIYNQISKKEIGLLQELKNTLKIDKPHLLEHQTLDREKVMFLINKVLSKKFVYGY